MIKQYGPSYLDQAASQTLSTAKLSAKIEMYVYLSVYALAQTVNICQHVLKARHASACI